MKKRNYVYDFVLGFAAIMIIAVSAFGLNFKNNKEIDSDEKLKAGAAPEIGHFTGVSFTVGNQYFDDVTQFPKIETYDGDYAGNASYCFDLEKDTPISTVNYSTKTKAGYDAAYVVQNGYKGATATTLNDELLYYGSQLVMHKLSGVSLNDVTQHVDSLDASTKADLIDYMNDLIDGAATYKANVEAGLTLNSNQSAFALNKVTGENYYETSDIVVNSNTTGITIALSLASAPNGAKIVNSSGTEISSVAPGGSYRIRVPEASLSDTTTTFTVNYSASRTVYYTYLYQPDDTNYQPVILGETFNETQNGNGSVSITGQLEQEDPTYSITITKQDGNGSNLGGATLRLETNDGSLIEEWNTSTSNPKTISGLVAGTYILKETVVPTGYTGFTNLTINVNETSEKNIVVNNTAVPEEDKGNISILKTDGTNPLAGAKLQILNSSNDVVREWTTDATGTAVFTGLPVGTYTIKEVEAPEGYVLIETGRQFTITNNAATPDITIVNSSTKVLINKIDSTTNKPVAGATLEIRDASGNQVASWVSDGTEHEILSLPYGTYSLRETAAPNGYALNEEEISFTLDASNQSSSLIMTNDPIIEVPKTALNISKTIMNLGLFLIMIGGGLVYYYVKHPKNEQ